MCGQILLKHDNSNFINFVLHNLKFKFFCLISLAKMEILPLAYKPKQATALAYMKKAHAEDVYKKNQLLK